MIKLGMVGKTLIHNYPYAAYFNGADDDKLEELCTKAWMLAFTKGRHPEPAAKSSRITHVWAGVREEAEAIAGSCRINHVCDTAGEVIDSVDGVLILDEEIDSRTAMIEQALNAGKSIFVDKVMSLCVDKTRELVALAQNKGVQVAAWSQLLCAAEAEAFQGAEGGAGLVTYNLSKDIVDKYGIHLVSTAFGAFGCDPVHMAKVDAGPDAAPAVVLTYADGKTVLLRAGQDIPPRGNVAYFAKGQEPITASFGDMGEMFDRSAAALAAMFEEGKPPVPADALIRMAEACALLCA